MCVAGSPQCRVKYHRQIPLNKILLGVLLLSGYLYSGRFACLRLESSFFLGNQSSLPGEEKDVCNGSTNPSEVTTLFTREIFYALDRVVEA